jgi:tripartite-type tricarboxylate transporter receptor subunit TctC
MKSTKFMSMIAAALAAGLATVTPALSQDYPTRPIKLLVPFAAGGSTDLIGRIVIKSAEKHLGKPIIVENKPGAGTMLALNELVGARPDGYTIGMTTSTLILQPLYGVARYDYPKELRALAQVAVTPPILAVNAQSEWKDVGSLLTHAKANPHKVKYGITGVGNSAHLGPAQLALLAKAEIDPVTFDGGAPLMAALLGGHVDAAAGSPVDYKEQIRAGKIRAIVSFGSARSDDPILANIPTAKEAGYDVEITSWTGISGPKNLPPAVVEKLGQAFKAAMEEPEVKEAIAKLGSDPQFLGPDDFAKRWVEDGERMLKIVTDTGILQMVKSQSK